MWGDDFQGFWNHHSKDVMKKEVEDQENSMEDLKQLLEGMLCRDPNSRFSIQEVVDHPWLQGERIAPV